MSFHDWTISSELLTYGHKLLYYPSNVCEFSRGGPSYILGIGNLCLHFPLVNVARGIFSQNTCFGFDFFFFPLCFSVFSLIDFCFYFFLLLALSLISFSFSIMLRVKPMLLL